MSDAAILRENVSRVRSAIAAACRRSGRNSEEITLIGVTKSVGRPLADALIAAGVHDLGENRVQDAVEKFGRRSTDPPLPPDVRLHMIGNLQTNKARDVVTLFSTVHSVNRTAVADALQHEAARQGVQRAVLLEINTAEDVSKQGIDPRAVMDLYGHVVQNCTDLHIVGLMTIAAQVTDPEETRPAFRSLRLLRDLIVQSHPAHPLPLLSMGMSNDFPIAIEEGATHIRVGRALFGGLTSPN